MPRFYNRRSSTRRTTRRGSATPLVALLLIAVLLLIVIDIEALNLTLTRLNLPRLNLPPLPDITIPITGLPQVQIPAVEIPLTLEPGTLVPGISIAGTPVPEGIQSFGQQTKEQGCQLNGALPDPACTPGSVISQDAEVICQTGYAGSVRDTSGNLTGTVYAAYDITDPAAGAFQVDHLVPLSLGGSNDISNLWPNPANPRPGYAEKDQVEAYIRDQVCAEKLSLADAQQQIARNWVEVWNKMPR